MKSVLVFALLLALGCSSDERAAAGPVTPDAQASGCHFVFSGNLAADEDRDSCATITSSLAQPDDAGADDAGPDAGTDAEAGPDSRLLVVDFSSREIASFHAQIELGERPRTGSFSSETPTAWDITLTTSAGCAFVAGNEVVPNGSFTLALDALPDSGADAGAPRGKLDATLTLHAEPGMDCGPGDNESVTVAF